MELIDGEIRCETEAMSKCWAAPLQNCAGKISREHVISRGTFADDELLVQGFDWCRDAPAKISLSGLTRKILCVKHNSDLSTADDAGIRAVEEFRELVRLGMARSNAKPRQWRLVRSTIDGFELERWFLKTLINVAFRREYPIGKPIQPEWRPSRELVEIAFGLRRFQPRAGLYLIGGETGDNVNPSEKLQILTFTDSDQKLLGARFLFFGFTFLIYLEVAGPKRYVQFLNADGRATPGRNLIYHPRAINFTLPKSRRQKPNDQRLSHVLLIGWGGKK